METWCYHSIYNYVGGQDFTNIKSTLTLLPSENQMVICITINEDIFPEERESFYCIISISQRSKDIAQVTVSQAIVFIEDNDCKYNTIAKLVL